MRIWWVGLLALPGACATTDRPPGVAAAAAARATMVARIRAGVRRADPAADDPAFEAALASVAAVRRDRFVVPALRRLAYHDFPLPIGYGQTISDAYIVAVMTAALRLAPGADVLDVGTGSGYQAAVLAPLARWVTSLEIVAPLARSAARLLVRLGYRNVDVHVADGFAGWPARAPFDGIVVAAGAAQIPQPLLDQLKPGARLVMPIGPSTLQEQILVVTKAKDGSTTRCSLGGASFVPLTGRGERPPTLRGLIDRSMPLCFARPVT